MAARRLRAALSGGEQFRLDDELIQELRDLRELDACGACPECLDERCPCWLLGHGGEPVQVGGDDATGWWFRPPWPAPPDGQQFGTLREAVEACRAALRR